MSNEDDHMDSKKEEELCSEGANRLLESQEINNTEHDIIKGDSIGETLYSAKWILNALISLSKVSSYTNIINI